MIPKIATFVWMSCRDSNVVLDNVARFRTLCPDWEIRLIDSIPDDVSVDVAEALKFVQRRASRAELLKWWALRETGGIVMDGDVGAIRSFQDLTVMRRFWASKNGGRDLSTHVMGASQQDALVRQTLEALIKTITIEKILEDSAETSTILAEWIEKNWRNRLYRTPEHYFSIFRQQGTASDFLKMSTEQQLSELNRLGGRIKTNIPPFAIKTWGLVPKEKESESVPIRVVPAQSSPVEEISAEEASRRLSICLDCQHFVPDTEECRQCPCRASRKVAGLRRCPLQKW